MTERALCISVIIPAYNSAGTIGACLEALRRQTWRDFQVIVVNSSLEPDTARLVRSRYPEVQFIQSPVRLLPHAARNRGVELARGDLLVFTDPDCEADPDWLERLSEAFEESSPALVGSMELRNPGWWQNGVHLLKFHGFLSGLPVAFRRIAPTANAAYSRDLWNRIGPFPGDYYAGDGIVSVRAARTGHTPRFVPSATVRHQHPPGAMQLFVQRFVRGRDYAHAQLEAMGVPKLSTWVRLLFSWTALPLTMTRAARDAFYCGWTAAYWLTIPIQAMGHELWALGETCGALDLLARRIQGRAR